ncbi:MAG: hypothetical protein K2L16_05660 [Muribaculaceae bacterium]|nr:hypothetical protein [Muribaculaceae bacterium]
MNKVMKAPRLERLRQGFDLTIERLYINKASKEHPVVVAAPNGDPCRIPASEALDRFRREKKPVC